jgi:hypothetical protein
VNPRATSSRKIKSFYFQLIKTIDSKQAGARKGPRRRGVMAKFQQIDVKQATKSLFTAIKHRSQVFAPLEGRRILAAQERTIRQLSACQG